MAVGGVVGRPAGADVLVADDDAAARRSTAEILRRYGMHVTEAADGDVALTQISAGTVGAIVLDVKMPRLGGLELIDALPDPPPIIVLTAGDWAEEITLRGRRRKVYALLRKPVQPAELVETVERALAGLPKGKTPAA
jgi:CheY-like chemotaxis protein